MSAITVLVINISHSDSMLWNRKTGKLWIHRTKYFLTFMTVLQLVSHRTLTNFPKVEKNPVTPKEPQAQFLRYYRDLFAVCSYRGF